MDDFRQKLVKVELIPRFHCEILFPGIENQPKSTNLSIAISRRRIQLFRLEDYNMPIFARYLIRALAIATLILPTSVAKADFTIAFDQDDFVVNPIFSDVGTFSFEILVAEVFQAGVFSNPIITIVDYQISGILEPGTPSGFPAFALSRIMDGDEFYAQGSSLNFEIAATADLSDGLQVSELVGNDMVFVFDGHEDGTGRFHPAIFVLNSDGTGLMQNSDNTGAGPNMDIDVDFGEEYITELTFNPSTLTIATGAVPEPSALVILISGCLAGLARRRRA
jgi:hypothetical protein